MLFIRITYKNFGVFPTSLTYSQKETDPSELVEARYLTEFRSAGQKWMDVIVPPCPVKTATFSDPHFSRKMAKGFHK